MSHSISHTEPTDQKHSINLCNHERYPVHLKYLRNIQKIKYPDFQAMTLTQQLNDNTEKQTGLLKVVEQLTEKVTKLETQPLITKGS